jgi:hypothetical protein
VTDDGLGEPGAARPRLQAAMTGLALIVGVPGNGTTERNDQLGFHHAAAVCLLRRSVPAAHAPPMDASA